MTNDKITVYFYTAWNGYSWQGCDPDTERTLQRYMEATGTLPQTAGDRVPYGGAIACIIKGTLGVAVYRYHVRKQGDAFNRDSLYIALAFIPGGTPLIDFAKLLESEAMNTPRMGEQLEPITISSEGLTLEPGCKTEDWVVLSQTQTYAGPSEFQGISVLFQTPFTQLGLPKAKFLGTSPQDQSFKAEFTYNVFPEVEKVEAARKELRRKREIRKIVDERDPAYVGLARALEELAVRKDKLPPGYKGLEKFIEVVRSELKNDDQTRRMLETLQQKLTTARQDVLNMKIDCQYWSSELDRRIIEDLDCKIERLNRISLIARDFDQEKPIDCDDYRTSCKLALQISEEAAKKIQLYNTCKNLLLSVSEKDVPAVLNLLGNGAVDGRDYAFSNLRAWAQRCMNEWLRSHAPKPEPASKQPISAANSSAQSNTRSAGVQATGAKSNTSAPSVHRDYSAQRPQPVSKPQSRFNPLGWFSHRANNNPDKLKELFLILSLLAIIAVGVIVCLKLPKPQTPPIRKIEKKEISEIVQKEVSERKQNEIQAEDKPAAPSKAPPKVEDKSDEGKSKSGINKVK